MRPVYEMLADGTVDAEAGKMRPADEVLAAKNS